MPAIWMSRAMVLSSRSLIDDVRRVVLPSATTVFVHVCDDVVAGTPENEGFHLFDGPEVAAGAVAGDVLIISDFFLVWIVSSCRRRRCSALRVLLHI